jgi:mannosyltransferase OCH1-like enzyme
MTAAQKLALVQRINPWIARANVSRPNQNPERVSIVLDNSNPEPTELEIDDDCDLAYRINNPDPITWAIDTDDLEG